MSRVSTYLNFAGTAEEAFGYCNLLRHRYPESDAGSPLREIRLFVVRYDLPPPGVDARRWLRILGPYRRPSHARSTLEIAITLDKAAILTGFV